MAKSTKSFLAFAVLAVMALAGPATASPALDAIKRLKPPQARPFVAPVLPPTPYCRSWNPYELMNACQPLQPVQAAKPAPPVVATPVVPEACRVPDWQVAAVVKAVPTFDASRLLLVQPKSDSTLNPAYVPEALAVDGKTWLCTEARTKAYVVAMTAPLPAAYYGGGLYSPTVGGPVYVRSHTRCNSRKCWNVRSYTRRR